MKTLTILPLLFFLLVLTSYAQTKADKTLTRANTAVQSANNTATNGLNSVSSTASQAKALANMASGIIPKNPNAPGLNITEITITGSTFGTLKKLNDSILTCPGVKTTKMKFNAASSTISVSHKGTTASLLKLIEKKSGGIFNDDNIDDFDEGKISIKLK